MFEHVEKLLIEQNRLAKRLKELRATQSAAEAEITEVQKKSDGVASDIAKELDGCRRKLAKASAPDRKEGATP